MKQNPSRTHRLLAKLRPLALVAAAAVCGAGTTAHADLVGRWFSGAETLNDTSGFGTPGTHNGVAVGANAHLLSYNSDVPAGFTGKSLDLKIGNVGVMIANSANTDGGYVNTFDQGLQDQMTVAFWAKGFPGNWAGWISKRGEDGVGWQVRRFSDSPVPCFTLRGLADEDGSGGTISVNQNPPVWHHYAAVWDKSSGMRYLYVDGVLSHTNTTTFDKPSVALAPNKHLGIGARQTGGSDFESFFLGLIYDVRVYNSPLTSTEVAYMVPPKTPVGLTATGGKGRIALTWPAVHGAASYTVTTRHGTTNALQTDVITAEEGLAGYSFTKTLGLENGTQYFIKISATNPSGTSAASAEVSATPTLQGSSAKDILTFDFDYLGPATISGTNIIKNVPVGTDVTNIAPIYTTSPLSLQDPNYESGNQPRDFTTPQTYTITAEDGSTKVYTVTVVESTPLTFDFNNGLQGWSQIWPLISDGFVLRDSRLNAGGDNDETRFARSPAFYLNNVGPLTFDLMGGQSLLGAPGFGPSAIPQLSQAGGFAGAALRDVASNTYVLSKARTGNGDAQQNNSFTAAELAPFANNGRQYTLDYIDYNRGGWGWTNMDNVSVPGTLAPTAEMTSMTLMGRAAISGDNITLTLPFGSSVTALAPTFTLSAGATVNKASGSTQNFTSPVTYTVTSSDSAVTRTYTVTAVVLPDPATALVGHWVSGAENLTNTSVITPAGTHDGVAAGSNAGALAFNPNDVPLDFGGSSLDLRAGNVAVQIANTASSDGAYVNTFDQGIRSQVTIAFWAKGFPGEWNPWVSKGGEDGIGWQVRRFGGNPNATFTMRGIENEDAPGSLIVVNQNPPVWHHYAGVWDQASGTRSLYVDGVLSHDTYNAMGQLMALAPLKHLFLGARQGGNNVDIGNYFQGLLYDVRIYKQKLFASQVQTVMTTPTTPQGAEAKLRNFGIPGYPAVISGTNVTWTLPIGTDLAALAPTFTLTAGAVSNPVSGTVRDFATPQTYTVTGSDSSVNVYTVNVILGNNFNTDNTLDGWHNRVWNAATSAWVDLAPDVWEVPAHINGGATHPPGLSSLFRTGFGAVEATEVGTGARDLHLNTLWLRSPQFNVGGGGDLTLKLAKGTSHTGIAPANEAAIPFAAIQDGGWMGVILRRVSDGAFVLNKAKSTGNDDTYRTYTFTQSELAPFVGVACTLELINADKGSWGWIAMDDVQLPPGSSTPAVVGSPFDIWIGTNYPGLSDKSSAGDPDGDGLSNLQEYAFGLDPSSGASSSPITVQLDKTAGTFRYTRRDPAVSGLTYTVLTSPGLAGWATDAGATASQTVVGTTGDVQTVAVTLTGAPLTASSLFVRVKAD
ncbi:hypothetical protein JIN84_00610 [Luteolibacter yonseiensis]|uniref:Fibronectin type-III domain-containing protein n=1 Tax=Luteolibacter yonseiensis TaxID=1144680 RepID=A0A934R0V9_9BACT|nr:LamG-like jellyroll fold domain-containing protein [Luteolibacter yonseiensis]MBK1814108.1 hypothetical protein [Luteolibacter yonseiensis]